MKGILTEVLAKSRAQSVLTGVTYDLFLNLPKGKDYSGLCSYKFKIADKKDVFLDFTGKQLTSATLNGDKLSSADLQSIWQGGHLALPKDSLLLAGNDLTLEFKNQYFNDGNGLHSFTDTDGKQYIYNQSEPYWANRIFPLFDQPDIKGRLTLRTLTPIDWKIITNTPAVHQGSLQRFLLANPASEFEEAVQKHLAEQAATLGDEVRYHQFAQTQLLPTYLYGFAAGPFAKIPEDTGITLLGQDMTIYCRWSLERYASSQKKFLFEYGVQATKFYNKFFQVEYPFQKFDFVFCPEFTVGAMEYPGIVTYNDRYLFREKPTLVQVSHRGETIVHELAHMWFGNLVTMKWWNDLWLNEAFASWVSYLANHHISRSLSFSTVNSWNSFQIQKFRAYNEDQEITTHPIACDVASTDKADSIFDAITYCKGAAVLHQLYYLLGHELFSRNIATYFKRHRWSNATLIDFIDAMAEGTEEVGLPISLRDWNKMWIETAGLNQVEVDETTMKITEQGLELEIHQTAVLPEFPLLRFHKMKLGLAYPYSSEKSIYSSRIQTVEVMVQDQPVTKIVIPEVSVLPSFVLPNYGDHAYVRIKLGPKTISTVNSKIEPAKKGLLPKPVIVLDEMSALLVARSIFESVRDGKESPNSLIDFIMNQFPGAVKKSNLLVLDAFISMIHECIFKFGPKKNREESAEKIFNFLVSKYKESAGPEVIKTLHKKFVAFAMTNRDKIRLGKFLEKDLDDRKKNFSVTDMWNIVMKIHGVRRLVSAGDTKTFDYGAEIRELVRREDRSELARYAGLFTNAMGADLTQRWEIWRSVIDPKSTISFGDLEYILGGMFSIHVDDASKQPFWDAYFEVLPEVIRNHSKTYARTFLTTCLPDTDDIDPVIAGLTKVLSGLSEQDEYFRILIRKTIRGLERKKNVLAHNN